MQHTSKIAGTLVLGALMLASVACSSGGGTSSGGSGTSTAAAGKEATAAKVAVTEKEFSITASPASLKTGEVHFVVQNAGAVDHEFVVVQSTAAPDKLPVYTATDKVPEGRAVGDVNEDKITSAGELQDIKPGASKDATFKLAAGKYVLICNLPSHYQAGMHLAFTVQ